MRAVVVMVMVALAAPVFAQPAPPPAQQANRHEKIKKRIRALRAYTLTEELALDEQTAGKLFPMLAKYDDEFDRLLSARADLQRRLAASASITDAKQLDKLIDDATANQRALWDTEDKRLAEMRKILTPAQVARVLVVLPAMERKIQNQLRRAAAGAKAPQDAEDELGPNPYDDRPAKRAAQRRRGANADTPCDPFSTMTGCKR